MEINLTKKQRDKLSDFLSEATKDYDEGFKGVIQAQIYDGFMTVHYIKNECAIEMREVMKRHHPENFHK